MIAHALDCHCEACQAQDLQLGKLTGPEFDALLRARCAASDAALEETRDAALLEHLEWALMAAERGWHFDAGKEIGKALVFVSGWSSAKLRERLDAVHLVGWFLEQMAYGSKLVH